VGAAQVVSQIAGAAHLAVKCKTEPNVFLDAETAGQQAYIHSHIHTRIAHIRSGFGVWGVPVRLAFGITESSKQSEDLWTENLGKQSINCRIFKGQAPGAGT